MNGILVEGEKATLFTSIMDISQKYWGKKRTSGL